MKYLRNLLFGYLSIISLRNKIIDFREIIFYLLFDYFVLSETKINDSFPSAQFGMSGYEIRARRDRDRMGEMNNRICKKGSNLQKIKSLRNNNKLINML